MEAIGLLSDILIGAANIDKGRKYLASDGHEHAGRLAYEDGISIALNTFKKASNHGFAVSADPRTMILVEMTYLQQELHFCNEADTITISSLTQAIQSYDDALRSLKIVEDSTLYKAAEATYPTSPKYRYHGFPRDAVHLAANLRFDDAHRTRLKNTLRSPGINMIEKAVLAQRISNITTIKASYSEKQRTALKS